MGNVNTQSPIPLSGGGFVAKVDGAYGGGEFAKLTNVEIGNDGTIINRRNIVACGATTPDVWEVRNAIGFIGSLRQFSVAVGTENQLASDINVTMNLWDPNDLPVPEGTDSFHVILRVLEYSDKWYWVTLAYDSETQFYKFYVYWTAEPSADALPNTVSFASLTSVELFSVPLAVGNPFVFGTVFVHKDRLWIVSNHTIWFSKATDFTVFTVPEGGFISIADEHINFAFSLSDSVYILCDKSVYMYTYTVDPNEDAYLRSIATTMGGIIGVAHHSVPYMINRQGVYSIANGNIYRIHEGNFDIGPDNTSFDYRLVSFEDYLVVLRYKRVTFNSVPEYSPKIGYFQGKSWDTNGPNKLDYNLFFLNVEQQSTHVVDFRDSRDSVEPGYVLGLLPVYQTDKTDNYGLHLLTSRHVSGTYPTTDLQYSGSTYIMNSHNDRTIVRDIARLSNGLQRAYKPEIEIVIEGFVPDGNEYLNKKFRNLLIMGTFPDNDFNVSVALNNEVWRGPVGLPGWSSVDSRNPNSARVGINQRGRALSINFRSTNVVPEPLSYEWQRLHLADLRVLWSYAQRLPVHVTETAANMGRDY